MSKLINVNDEGVIWVESDSGIVLGIVTQTKIIDEDGLPYQEDTLKVLEQHEFELTQDWGEETTSIDVLQDGGETSRVVIGGGFVNLVKVPEGE